ncbi:MAG: hypothetical protein AB2L11_09725 [Syntrophobacteraceae bacterium]
MPQSPDSANHHQDKELSLAKGLIFYAILALSVILPAILAFCAAFMDFVVTGLLFAAFGAVFVWLIFAYHRLGEQLEEFNRNAETGKLLEENQEISILGGLLSIRTEGKQPSLPSGESTDKHSELIEDQSEDIDRTR